MTTYNVLNLGAGLQSSRVLLGACKGELPKFDAVIFADTRWEPKAVYENVKWLSQQAEQAGMTVSVRGVGASIRDETLQFMRSRTHAGRKRYASAPFFIQNPDGSVGRLKRQCTSEYKINVVERFIRRELLGLKPGQRIPGGVLVRQWFGISDDEARRASFPGFYKSRTVAIGKDLFGTQITRQDRKWMPCAWRENVYPLLNQEWLHDRTIREVHWLPSNEQRSHVSDWLAKHYPERAFPRSACIGCPFRSNSEWREMRDSRPEEWADACEFDDLQRQPDAASQSDRKILVGTPYIHRQMVPLRMVDLGGEGERGGGCGTLYDGQDGMCDV